MAASDTINVKTNSPTGYKLYINTSSSDLTSTTTTSKFPSTSGTLSSPTALTLNTWGFSLSSPAGGLPVPSSSSTWSAVPTFDTKIAESSSPTTDSGIDTPIYYAINADTTMPTGIYTTTVAYTALAEGTLERTMQDFTITDCNNLDTDESTYLMDVRNNKIYRVVKARDGNCWMADNLSIYDQTLDSTTTNIEQGTTFTLPGTSNWNTNDYTQPLLHVATNSGYEGEVYYNWCSAVALTGSDCATTAQQQYDICPKGWTLPVNGDTTTDKSYAMLMDSYGITTGAQLLNQTSLGFSKYYGGWDWYNEVSQGGQSWFWSATASNVANGAYHIAYSISALTPQVNSPKGYGFSVRCVFENRDMSNITYMQDMTTQICDNTAEGTKKTLLDKRGTGNAGGTAGGYGALKAKDGNCWMTDNLNLYNKTISAADSDFSTGSASIPNTTNWQDRVVSTTMGRVHVGTNSGYVGEVYYNYCITQVCSNNSVGEKSICPKNWKMPFPDDDVSINKTYAKLLNTYNITTGEQLLAQTELGFTKYYGRWRAYDAREFRQGMLGYVRNSNIASDGTATTTYNYLNYNSTRTIIVLGDMSTTEADDGYTIRCVSR